MISNNCSNCPECRNVIHRHKITCQNCGADTYVSNPAKIFCLECKEELSKSESVKLFEQMKNMSTTKNVNNILTVPIGSIIDKERFDINVVKTCEHCGRLYVAHSNNSHFCGNCFHIYECKNCNKQYIVSPDKMIGENFCSSRCSSLYHRYSEHGVCEDVDNSSIPFQTTVLPQSIYNNNLITYKNVQYKNHAIEIDNCNIEKYRNIPGIWYITDEAGNIIQVSATTNIFKEWYDTQAIINYLLNGSYAHHCSYKQMMDDGIDLSKSKTYIIDICDDGKRRLDIEAHFAIVNKVKYWKPAPGYQMQTTYGYILEDNQNK